MVCSRLHLSIIPHRSGTCLYGRKFMLIAFERNTFIVLPTHPRFGPAIALPPQYIRCLSTFAGFPSQFAPSPALAISIPPPRSATASAVPSPGDTSGKNALQVKTSLPAARYSLALIRLLALLMLTQVCARQHLANELALLALMMWAGYHLQWSRPSL